MQTTLIAEARKILIKIGSNTLADQEGRINAAFLADFADQVAALVKAGKQILLVSSGAQVAGLSTLGKWARKQDLHYKQALCAVGQVELMAAWARAFAPQQLHIAQILLTRDDFGDPIRTLNMRNTLFTLVDEGIIPIINENDTVSVEEIKIGDNDTLAAQSAILWSAELVILFSDIDGLYHKNPKEDPSAELVQEVRDIAAIRSQISIGGTNSFGTGGIATKLDAAEQAVSYGIPLILAHGGRHRPLEALAAGTQRATSFFATTTRHGVLEGPRGGE
ncbi:MAG: glutamate 5-kinase [Spirochaetaceae bacterium]|jgi:glutamate 5-kinase|nr:glutamate 5-kinase [Spirochaetaceae bacterium]